MHILFMQVMVSKSGLSDADAKAKQMTTEYFTFDAGRVKVSMAENCRKVRSAPLLYTSDQEPSFFTSEQVNDVKCLTGKTYHSPTGWMNGRKCQIWCKINIKQHVSMCEFKQDILHVRSDTYSAGHGAATYHLIRPIQDLQTLKNGHFPPGPTCTSANHVC